MPKNFYITTTLPYVNARPHIGHALEFVEADVIARFHRMQGEEVIFNTGVDEHGIKIYEKALELGMAPQAYCDSMVSHFESMKVLLNMSYTHFVRTTDEHHIRAAQEFWRLCELSGDIYKKQYQVKYCKGCELEKTDSDLDHGTCPNHPQAEIQLIDEENYFFRFSRYQDTLLKLYSEQEDFVIPRKRLNEIKAFVERGLQDFSISRLKSKMPWGIPVPGDDHHVMYVWFDALVNYISTLGWPENKESFDAFWPAVQICGKDNLRQQSAMWQAMLLSAKLPTSKQILVNGFIQVGGQKMSKSLGNTISPEDMVERFGVDGARYLLLSGASIGEDIDFTWERLTEKFNADLANGLGNLVSRVMKLAQKSDVFAQEVERGATWLDFVKIDEDNEIKDIKVNKETNEYNKRLASYRLSSGLEYIWGSIGGANAHIELSKPWELVKTNKDEFEHRIHIMLGELATIAYMLEPFLPETSEKIKKMLMGAESEILFQRL